MKYLKIKINEFVETRESDKKIDNYNKFITEQIEQPVDETIVEESIEENVEKPVDENVENIEKEKINEDE